MTIHVLSPMRGLGNGLVPGSGFFVMDATWMGFAWDRCSSTAITCTHHESLSGMIDAASPGAIHTASDLDVQRYCGIHGLRV